MCTTTAHQFLALFPSLVCFVWLCAFFILVYILITGSTVLGFFGFVGTMSSLHHLWKCKTKHVGITTLNKCTVREATPMDRPSNQIWLFFLLFAFFFVYLFSIYFFMMRFGLFLFVYIFFLICYFFRIACLGFSLLCL